MNAVLLGSAPADPGARQNDCGIPAWNHKEPRLFTENPRGPITRISMGIYHEFRR